MSLIRTLTSKPWINSLDDVGDPADSRAFTLPRQKVGLRVFLGVVTSLFLLFIVSYRMRMYYEDWVPLQEPLLLYLNTVVLVLASVFMQLAKNNVATGNVVACRRWVMLGGAAAVLFVAGQLLVWWQLAGAGHFVSSNPASSFFYLITAVHGLHMLGGIFALLWVMQLAGSQPERYHMGVDLCTVYWHYLLLVWAVLFYMLLTT